VIPSISIAIAPEAAQTVEADTTAIAPWVLMLAQTVGIAVGVEVSQLLLWLPELLALLRTKPANDVSGGKQTRSADVSTPLILRMYSYWQLVGHSADDDTNSTTDPSYTSTDSTQFYPASNQFAPPPAPQQYPQQTIHPNYSEPYMSGANNVPAYNPADYGPTNGPTLPREDPLQYPDPQPYSQYDHPYGPPETHDDHRHRPSGPENVSVPLAYEHSEPGTSRQSRLP
jgi:hypothetical protein